MKKSNTSKGATQSKEGCAITNKIVVPPDLPCAEYPSPAFRVGETYSEGECVEFCKRYRVSLTNGNKLTPQESDDSALANRTWTPHLSLCELIQYKIEDSREDVYMSGYTAQAPNADGSVEYVSVLLDHADGDNPVANGDTGSFIIPAPNKPKAFICVNDLIEIEMDLGPNIKTGMMCPKDPPAQVLPSALAIKVVGNDLQVSLTTDGNTIVGKIDVCSLLDFDCPAGKMSVVKSVDQTTVNNPTLVGDKIKFTFVVTNTGDVDGTGITLTDDNATVSGGPIDLVVGANNATAFTAIHTVTTADIIAGEVINTASVSGTFNGDTITASSDQASGNGAPLVVPLSKAVPKIKLELTGVLQSTGTPVVGDEIFFSYVITNTGVVPLTNVVVTDAGITVLAGPISLAAGATVTQQGIYKITATDLAAKQHTNSATVVGTYLGDTATDLSDDPTDLTNADTDADGTPDDPTVVAIIDVCDAVNTSTPTVAISDTLGNQIIGRAWSAPIAGVTMTTVKDSLGGQVLYYLLADNTCDAVHTLIAIQDSLGGQIVGYAKV